MSKETKLEILLKEYELVNQKIERFVANQFLYMQGTLVLVGGYIVFLIEGTFSFETAPETMVGVADNTKFYIQFLPYVLLTILMGIAYQFKRTIGLQGYKGYLEERLNALAGENLISYSHIGMHFMVKRSAISWINWGIYVAVYAAAVTLARCKPPRPIEDGYLISHIVLGIALLIIIVTQVSGYKEKVKKAAEKINDFKKEVSKVSLKKLKTSSSPPRSN